MAESMKTYRCGSQGKVLEKGAGIRSLWCLFIGESGPYLVDMENCEAFKLGNGTTRFVFYKDHYKGTREWN